MKTMKRKSTRIIKKEKKPTKNKTRSRKSSSVSNMKKSYIVRVFFETIYMVKLYHWKTHSYAQHKATDELYSKLNENMDKFIEVLMGKDESRINMIENKIRMLDYNNLPSFKDKIYEFRNFLNEMDNILNEKKDSDLLSIRDDILVDINQFLYLLTLD